nr:hypothetical protein [Tanacetum cinerariifolium]
ALISKDIQTQIMLAVTWTKKVLQDPSKVTDIELTAHMVVVNNRRDSVSPPPLATKPKKGKSQTVTSTLPKSQGLEASGALSKKSKIPKSKRHPLKPWDITSTTLDEGTAKTTSCLEGSLGDKYSRGNIPPADMKPIHTYVADSSGTGAKYQDELEKESDKEEVLAIGDDMDEDSQDDAKTGQLVASSMSYLDKSNSSISDLYKGLNVITVLLKDINNAVKDDLTTNKKIDEAIKTFAKISPQTTEIPSLVKTFDFSTLQSTIQDLQAYALKQKEASAVWANSSTYGLESWLKTDCS